MSVRKEPPILDNMTEAPPDHDYVELDYSQEMEVKEPEQETNNLKIWRIIIGFILIGFLLTLLIYGPINGVDYADMLSRQNCMVKTNCTVHELNIKKGSQPLTHDLIIVFTFPTRIDDEIHGGDKVIEGINQNRIKKLEQMYNKGKVIPCYYMWPNCATARRARWKYHDYEIVFELEKNKAFIPVISILSSITLFLIVILIVIKIKEKKYVC